MLMGNALMTEFGGLSALFAQADLFAQAELFAQADQGPGMLASAFPILVIFVLFYFLLMRPQQRERQNRQTLLDALKKNDRVVTLGGIVGIITSLRPDASEVTIRTHENTYIDVTRSSVARVITDEPADKKQEP